MTDRARIAGFSLLVVGVSALLIAAFANPRAVDGEHGVEIGEARYISWAGRKLARKPGVPALVLHGRRIVG